MSGIPLKKRQRLNREQRLWKKGYAYFNSWTKTPEAQELIEKSLKEPNPFLKIPKTSDWGAYIPVPLQWP
jgi:hypothetical protein